jgi:hypothetical protein
MVFIFTSKSTQRFKAKGWSKELEKRQTNLKAPLNTKQQHIYTSLIGRASGNTVPHKVLCVHRVSERILKIIFNHTTWWHYYCCHLFSLSQSRSFAVAFSLEPIIKPYSVFKFQTLTPSLSHPIFLVHVSFLQDLSDVFLLPFSVLYVRIVAIPVATVVTGIKKRFIFQIRWISIPRFLYFNFISASFCVTFLSDGTATSENNHILSSFFIIMSVLSVRTSLFVPHDAIIIIIIIIIIVSINNNFWAPHK